jgi:hypothetical protein
MASCVWFIDGKGDLSCECSTSPGVLVFMGDSYPGDLGFKFCPFCGSSIYDLTMFPKCNSDVVPECPPDVSPSVFHDIYDRKLAFNRLSLFCKANDIEPTGFFDALKRSTGVDESDRASIMLAYCTVHNIKVVSAMKILDRFSTVCHWPMAIFGFDVICSANKDVSKRDELRLALDAYEQRIYDPRENMFNVILTDEQIGGLDAINSDGFGENCSRELLLQSVVDDGIRNGFDY